MKLINLLAAAFITLTLAMLLGELLVDGLATVTHLVINDFRRLSRRLAGTKQGVSTSHAL